MNVLTVFGDLPATVYVPADGHDLVRGRLPDVLRRWHGVDTRKGGVGRAGQPRAGRRRASTVIVHAMSFFKCVQRTIYKQRKHQGGETKHGTCRGYRCVAGGGTFRDSMYSRAVCSVASA